MKPLPTGCLWSSWANLLIAWRTLLMVLLSFMFLAVEASLLSWLATALRLEPRLTERVMSIESLSLLFLILNIPGHFHTAQLMQTGSKVSQEVITIPHLLQVVFNFLPLFLPCFCLRVSFPNHRTPTLPVNCRADSGVCGL